MTRYISADPYPYPYDGDLRPDNTALIIIDMQTDFCGEGATWTKWATTSLSPVRPSSQFNACWG